MRFFLYLFVLVSFPSFAHAIYWGENSATAFESLRSSGGGDASDYQIGDEWGKIPVDRATVRKQSNAYARAAFATARFGGATAFYLGKFNGHHIMATNHHVMPKASQCETGIASFPLLKRQFKCEKFYGEWDGIDLALFSIRVPSQRDERLLSRVGRNFNFKASLVPGQKLITLGYGFFRNSARSLVGNADNDCRVFSRKDDYRFLADPDRINPADYKAWSFAMGCDISHGDSGSSVVDRETGDVVGIVWTTGTEKPAHIQDSKYLLELLKNNGDEIWTKLSYGVPAQAMKRFLEDYLSSSRPSDDDVVDTLKSILGR